MDFRLSEEQQLFRDSIRRWVDAECTKEWCRDLERREHEYPQELWDRLAAEGYHGVGIPEEYGGLGGDIIMQSIFMREFARNAAGLAWIWGITSISGAKSIGFYSSEAQKQRFLPEMAAGRLRAAMSFTEPGGGTDLLGALKTSARKVDGGWVLNGEKIWSTTANTADYLLVMARTSAQVKRRHEGVSLFFVPRESGGVTITAFLDAGLIQRIILTRIPVLLGAGIPLFGALRRDIPLRHLDTRAFPSGLVQSTYDVG